MILKKEKVTTLVPLDSGPTKSPGEGLNVGRRRQHVVATTAKQHLHAQGTEPLRHVVSGPGGELQPVGGRFGHHHAINGRSNAGLDEAPVVVVTR